VLRTAPLHRKFATMNGESSVTLMHAALKLHHDPHPWDDLWRSAAVEHPLRDDWWDERNLLPLLDRVEFPRTSAVTGRTSRCTCQRPSLPCTPW
jgi:hypothetical protein